MNKILCILILALLQVASALATPYDLKVELTPNGAGSLNTTGGSYEEGSSINLRAYTNTGYVFLGWYEGETQLSTSTSFKYTMPAHDVLVIAKYDFDPVVPADPDSMATKYTVTLECKPEGSGSFNTRNATYGEGDSTRFYAYTNTGYEFLYWENEQGEVISTSQNFYYVMPHGNNKIYGVFDFNPEPPANPAKNFWDVTTGEVIVDDFTPGLLSNAISSAIGDDPRVQVTMITVAGVMTDNDFGIANNYPNCTLLDLSRVTGITEIPSYAFDYTNLESVYLPSTIENIGARAFYNCTQLKSLTIYAHIPPVLGNNVFSNVPEGLIVYVPALYIGQYQKADGWSSCTILPLQEDVCSITVQLPRGTNVADYANMLLEITNKGNGQSARYVITDKFNYIFNNVLRNTEWDIVLKNQVGDIFGIIEGIEVNDEDITVGFSSLQKPQKATISVFTPDGKEITEQVQIIWYTNSGDYLQENASVSSLLSGKELLYDIRLKDSLGLKYQELYAQPYQLNESSQSKSVVLQKIPTLKLSGRVKGEYGNISNANIAIVQWANGHYNTTKSIQTSSNGSFEIEILNDSTRLMFSSFGYRSVTLYKKHFYDGGDLGTVVMERLSGIVITTDVKEHLVDKDTPQQALMDNISFSVYNKSTGLLVDDFEVQNRRIIISSGVKADDEIKVTVSDVSGNYISATSICTIAKNDSASVQLIMQELGGIESTYTASPNTDNVLYLYDSKGALVQHAYYSGKKVKFTHLEAGHYTLAAMGKSLLRGKLTKLSDIAEIGMQEGRDYVLSSIDVNDGEISESTFEVIPIVNESLFSYTSEETYLQANKLSVTAGQFVTLSSRLYFKDEYNDNVKDVKLIVDIPDGCEFVENSLIVGAEVAPYTLANNRITIMLSENNRNERVRFCIVPTIGGTHRLAAYTQFDYKGLHTQSAGDAYFEANSMALIAPQYTNKTSIHINGKATRMATVEIYDNGTFVGQTEALPNGNWKTTCTLNDVYNLSEHAIYAKIYGKDGLTLQTETQYVTYDKDAVEAKTVFMTFYNPYLHRNVDVVFDLQNGSNSVNSYSFNKTTPFTFIADLTNNDTTAVNSVYIHVYTSDENVTTLQANYDSNLQRWMAVQEFTSRNLPVNVSVTIDYNSSLSFDEDYQNQMIEQIANEISQYDVQTKSIEELYVTLENEIDNDTINRDFVNSIIEQIIRLENMFYGFEDASPDEEVVQKIANAHSLSEIIDIVNEFDFEDESEISIVDSILEIPSLELTNGLMTPNFKLICEKDLPQSDDIVHLLHEYKESLSTGNWEVSDITSDNMGCLTLTNHHGNIIVMDFHGIIDVPYGNSNEIVDEFLDSVIIYMEKLNASNFNIEAIISKQKEILVRNVSNYHFVLKSIINIESQIDISSVSSYRMLRRRSMFSKVVSKGKQLMNSKYGTFIKQSYNLLKTGLYAYDNGIATYNIIQDGDNWDKMMDDIGTKCKNRNPEQYKELKEQAEKQRKIDRKSTVGLTITKIATSTLGLAASCAGPGFIPVALGFGILNYACNHQITEKLEMSKKHRNELKKKAEEECCPSKNCLTPPPPPPSKPEPPVQPILDPSGFVYEAVTSNRLEGVTATVFQKVQEENMYGDMHDVIVKWNAEDFGQINPEITDKEGNYAWDVPQGQWQVKFEKEGYETTYSEWLPVPPPQLDINIGMCQNVQPTVKTVRAYEEAVEMEFDKYMMPEELNNYNITVIQDGKPVEGNICLLNEEASYENSDETFASKVRFNAAQPFTAQEVTLMVSNRVKSYAGIRIQDDFSQTFKVEREIKQILCDSLTVIGYGETATLAVSVLPASASKGKTLTVKTSSSMILGIETEQVVIGEDGNAEIVISGELPGAAALTFSVEDRDKTSITIVNVEQKDNQIVAAPTASIASGTVIERGTEVYLSCLTEDVTIYYTLDGSCPCDEMGSRKVYDGTPILINETTTIKAIAVASDMTESDVVEFTYIVTSTSSAEDIALNGEIQVYPLPIRDRLTVTAGGKTIKSATISSINGARIVSSQKVATKVTFNISTIPAGVYIINVTTGDGAYSRKILKVQ